ncbi:WxL domain-containing protein [Enterococcus faecalis]|uniref:WxL domain-containing protein n=1 Tax=Enterococcus faecalis TaxID=1351 RepID=UPI001785036B|nr:WxL domain-containing protein [Enterococcus faecalis]QOG34905.1 WxL domain-containing protein [Enterococcus faecalis]HAP4929792.1 WxL domain-containing protein [Enterococcus faecalis]
MKQIKFKQLATFGLCCSLLINSFTGITAIAETVTIESSPTVETAEPVTSAETTETEKKVATEQTEQETKAKEQQEHKETDATSQDTSEEDDQVATTQPNETPTSSSEANSPKIESRGIPLKTVVYPKVQYDFVDESGAPFATPLSFSGNYQARAGSLAGTPVDLPAPYNKLSTQTNGTGSYILSINNNAGFPLTPQMIEKYGPGGTTPSNKYRTDFILDKLNIITPLKFVDSIERDLTGSYSRIYMYKGFNVTTGIFDNSIEEGKVEEFDEDKMFKKNTLGSFEIVRPLTLSIASGGFLAWVAPGYESIVLRGFDGTNTIKSKRIYKVTRKQVTEKFVDGTGVAITPPTGFTQNKKTPMTSNNFTYTSAKALPETYKASNGKTYKFKGWYKGKTKPATLKTTKTPSYAVTYDDNDDLNVVYEEVVEQTATIPAVTYRFGFINEKGAMIAPSSFVMQTNLTTVMNATPRQVGTATGVNNGNLKHLTIPSQVLTHTAGTNTAFSGSTDFRLTVPRYYKRPTVIPGAYYTGSRTAYPVATTRLRFTNSAIPDERLDVNGGRYALNKTSTAHSYRMSQSYWVIDSTQTYFSGVLSQAVTDNSSGLSQPNYYTTDDTMYYFLENRRITENFVDSAGVKITPPTGFTQGKQTVIESTQYTFTQSGTLPDTYQANGKTYKFKGWYKGETKTATLRTTKTPSYAMTYDDNDDLNVVYEETKEFEFPALTYQFGFVDESGQRVDASTIGLTYDNWYGEVFSNNAADTNISANWQTVSLEKGQVAPTKNNLKEIVYPAQSLEILSGRMSQYSAANLTFALPKYYEKMSVYNKNGTFDAAYPIPSVQNNNSTNPIVEGTDKTVSKWFELKKSGSQSFVFNQTAQGAPTDVQVPALLREMVSNPAITTTKGHYYTLDKPVYYYLTNRKVTENFVDATGTKITPPTGFTQGNQILMTSDTFKYTSAKALPASYSAGGKTYVFQGWYKGKTKPNTLTTSTTPTYNTTFDDNDDMTAVYKEASISANLTMRGAVDVIDNGGTMEYWEVLLKNTGEAPLTSIKIKPTTDWAAGISTPTELFILGTGQNTKARPITKEQWEAGFEIPLDSSLPVGGQLTINLIGTKVTGQPGQVLEAAVEVTGNFGNLKASDTVRIKDLDQEIKEPTGEGFISVPTFDFGQVGVASATKQHGLKKAADYYGNGTRNPYVRISKTQPNWSLTAQLSQPKSATDSLPTATRLLLGAAPVSSFSNYNQPTELKNAIGTTNAIHLTANNAATSIIANQQFTGSDVYQLDFTFDNIKLEVPANQGTAGQQYQAAVTWNLVTGP